MFTLDYFSRFHFFFTKKTHENFCLRIFKSFHIRKEISVKNYTVKGDSIDKPAVLSLG